MRSFTVAVLALGPGSVLISCGGATGGGAGNEQPSAAAVLSAASPIDALIGRPPPPITVGKWVKGEPMTGFERGKVYVVDFWATWCGPCKAAIPHLTRLAQAHKGKVEVIGVSISEKQRDATDTGYIALVEEFVGKMGDRMDYRVAVDTPDKRMHASWFKPAGTGGIPTAYIIDQKGLVAWVGIGDPRDVERIAGEVLAGTFDIRKEIEVQRAAEAEAKKRSEADIAAFDRMQTGIYARYPGYKEAMDRHDEPAALESLNAAFKADPASETAGAYQWKFMLLMMRNKPEEVNAYATQLLETYPGNSDIVSYVSAAMFSGDGDSRFDPRLTLRAARMSDAMARPGTRWAQFSKFHLGWAYYHAGETAKAAEAMQAALDGVRTLKATVDFQDLEMECEEALKTFARTKK